MLLVECVNIAENMVKIERLGIFIIYVSKFKPKRNYELKNGIPVITTIARIEERKGFRWLFETLALLKKKVPVNLFEFAEFFGFEFKIKEGIHIPKNTTEFLIERVLAFADEKMKIIDIGCGCGNVAIVIAKLTKAQVWAVDIDDRALKIAEENAKKHGVKIKIVKSNVFDAIFE